MQPCCSDASWQARGEPVIMNISRWIAVPQQQQPRACGRAGPSVRCISRWRRRRITAAAVPDAGARSRTRSAMQQHKLHQPVRNPMLRQEQSVSAELSKTGKGADRKTEATSSNLPCTTKAPSSPLLAVCLTSMHPLAPACLDGMHTIHASAKPHPAQSRHAHTSGALRSTCQQSVFSHVSLKHRKHATQALK